MTYLAILLCLLRSPCLSRRRSASSDVLLLEGDDAGQNADDGQAMSSSPASEAFRWPIYALHLLRAAVSPELLQSCLAARPLSLSTSCSGIGSAEMAALCMESASLAALPFQIRVRPVAVCDTESACRRILQMRAPSACIHRDVFETCEPWDRDAREPGPAMRRLLAQPRAHCPRPCLKHGQLCAIRPDIEIAGTPCQPWSRRGLRKGLADSRAAVLFAWMGRVLQLEIPLCIHENVLGFPRPGIVSISHPCR